LDERKNASKGWTELLKPNIAKIVITLIVPAIVGLLVTHRIENTVDFYGYLLTPRLALWTGESIVYVFNRYVLLWIPFYLAACALVYIAGGRRFTRSQPHKGEDSQSPS
jgi:predicted Na+-dependent transporter